MTTSELSATTRSKSSPKCNQPPILALSFGRNPGGANRRGLPNRLLLIGIRQYRISQIRIDGLPPPGGGEPLTSFSHPSINRDLLPMFVNGRHEKRELIRVTCRIPLSLGGSRRSGSRQGAIIIRSIVYCACFTHSSICKHMYYSSHAAHTCTYAETVHPS